jgi:hypothetical protein
MNRTRYGYIAFTTVLVLAALIALFAIMGTG